MRLERDRGGFTIVEIVFIIVIIGIISAVAVRKIGGSDTSLYEARDQIINHLKYAQHLAINDEKFLASPEIAAFSRVGGSQKALSENWKERMWRLRFHNLTKGKDKVGWTYSVYSENPTISGKYNDNPAGHSLIARDPISGLCVSYYNANEVPKKCYDNATKTDNRDKNLLLTKRYGITKIELESKECSSKSPVIYFDSSGAPYCGSNKVKLTEPLAIRIKNSDAANNDRSMAIVCIAPNTGRIWHLTKSTTSQDVYKSTHNPCENP